VKAKEVREYCTNKKNNGRTTGIKKKEEAAHLIPPSGDGARFGLTQTESPMGNEYLGEDTNWEG